MDYTRQKELGKFGARWGCYATCLINIVETELYKKLSDDQIYQAIGAWFVSGNVLLANYKDHNSIKDVKDGWSEEADPEYHFYIVSQQKALQTLADLFLIPNLKHEYTILRLKTKYGSHFILQTSFEKVNPDPGLSGDIVEWREVSL